MSSNTSPELEKILVYPASSLPVSLTSLLVIAYKTVY